MKKLKRKSLQSVLVIVVIFWILAIEMGRAVLPSLFTFLQKPTPWDEVDFSGDIEGLYITGTLYGIYDWYCEETEDGKTTSREYLIPADGYYYMGLYAEGVSMDKADALMEASYAYLSGNDDGTLLQQAQYEVTGTITAIPSQSLDFYHEFLGWSTLDEDTRDMFLPYYIAVNNAGALNPPTSITFSILTATFFLLGCLFLFLVFAGHYQKSIKKYIANSPNRDMAREKVEYFLENTPEVDGLRYNLDFICGNEKGTTAFGETSKLVWAYLHTTTHQRYFITINTTYSLVLCFADGCKQSAAVKNEAIGHEHLQKLSELCPQAVFGYSAELDKMFCNDFSGFLNLKYNKER